MNAQNLHKLVVIIAHVVYHYFIIQYSALHYIVLLTHS